MKLKLTHQRLIGLTGSIATGKTTVADYLATTYKLPVLDADIYAREAVAPGSSLLTAIVQRYGLNILLPDGNLNRQQLGEIIFQDSQERRWLEQLIHPHVRQRLLAEINASAASTIVLVIPLLFEAGMTDLVTEIWVVWCEPKQQLNRLMQRSNLTRQAAQARISSQMPLTQKCAAADVVLDNSATLQALYQQIDNLLRGEE